MGSIYYFPQVRDAKYCLPSDLAETKETFPLLVNDDLLASSGIKRGFTAVACELRPTDLLRDGDLTVLRYAGKRIVKRVFFEQNGYLRLADDSGSVLVHPQEIRVDARVVHACSCMGAGCNEARPDERESIGNWIAGPNGMNTWVSPEWLDLFDLSPDESGGAAWLRRIHPDDVARVAHTWLEAVSQGESYAITNRILSRGDYRLITAASRPVKNYRGEIIRWEGVVYEAQDRAVNF